MISNVANYAMLQMEWLVFNWLGCFLGGFGWLVFCKQFRTCFQPVLNCLSPVGTGSYVGALRFWVSE